MNVLLCDPVVRWVLPLYQRVVGVRPDAITIGDVTFYASEHAMADPRLQRHEAKHVAQELSFCPSWLRWAPRSVRVWAGALRMAPEYLREHQAKGYAGNRFEIEARAAEDP